MSLSLKRLLVILIAISAAVLTDGSGASLAGASAPSEIAAPQPSAAPAPQSPSPSPAGADAAREPARPQVGIGYEAPAAATGAGGTPAAIADPTATTANPLYVRIELFWTEAETTRGAFDWTKTDAIVDRFRAAHHVPVLDLWGGNPLYSEDILKPPTAEDAKTMEAWEQFVREATRHFKDRVRFFQVGKGPDSPAIWGRSDSVRSYAYLLKKTAVIIRAEHKDAVIVTGGLAGADASWLDRLYGEGAAVYIDIVSFRPDPRQDLAAQCEAILVLERAKDGSAGLWAESVVVSGTGQDAGRDLVRKLLTVFDHGVSAVFFRLPDSKAEAQPVGESLVRAHSALSSKMGRVPSADRISFTDGAGAAIEGVTSVSFFEPEAGLSVTGYWAAGPSTPRTATVHLMARRPGPPTVYDPVTGQRSDPKFLADAGGASGEIPLGPSPLFLVYREGVSGQAGGEAMAALAVSAARGITADEVIERNRVFQAAQDARLTHYNSEALITYHFRLAATERTIDIGLGGTYFYEPKGASEWEIKDYYIAGNKSKWKSFPEIPLIQPEKVLTLPLDITFDRSYEYQYVGEDTIEGRDCHVLSFAPVDKTRSLYRGKLWIDKTTWARVRVFAIQTNLEPPIPSSEETTTYAPVKGPDGTEFWVATRIDGQQIYSAAGRSLVVLREIEFKAFHFNDPDFAARREMAEESEHQILRDTDKGMRYVVKDDSGQRVVKEMNTNQLFALGGALYDPSLTHVVPLAGVNYFDYNFMKTGLQTNLFFAGAFLALNVTDPNLGGTGFDLGGDLFLSALAREDKDFREGEEIEARSVETRQQSVAFNFGTKVGEFTRLRATYEIEYQGYAEADDTDAAYIVPADTIIQTSRLIADFNRAGYGIRGEGSYEVRDTFRFWGDPCQASNPAPRPSFCTSTSAAAKERRMLLEGDDFNPHGQDYLRFQANGSKEFFLQSFQKLRVSLNLYGGADLDRFSRFSFNRTDAPLAGFAGSGIRFDSGGILRGAYLFNIADVIRFEASLAQAWVRTKGSSDVETNHTGLGISANVLGPWKTVWQLEYGYALRSDISDVQGDQDVLLVILKLF